VESCLYLTYRSCRLFSDADVLSIYQRFYLSVIFLMYYLCVIYYFLNVRCLFVARYGFVVVQFIVMLCVICFVFLVFFLISWKGVCLMFALFNKDTEGV
jgi:hypothetical protein